MSDPLAKERKEYEKVTRPAYERAYKLWKSKIPGERGSPPPRPVPPHIPGPQ